MTTVTVVGAGVIGMTTALALLEADFEVRIVAKDDPAHTVSAVAAAVWWPFHVAPVSRRNAWGAVSFQRFVELAAKTPEAGVIMRRGLQRLRAQEDEPWWANVPDAHLIESDSDDYELLSLTLPVIDMPVYLRWLEDQLAQLGVRIERMELTSLDEAPSSDVLVNCSGLGARDLTGDTDLYPLRGQVVEMYCPSVDTFSCDESGPGGLTHVHPRSSTVILGGITERSESTEIDDAATKSIIERCTELDPRLVDGQIVGVKAGLRPARSEVRLELDRESFRVPVVHNYGHGGGGVTLSWGCAEEARNLCITATSELEGRQGLERTR